MSGKNYFWPAIYCGFIIFECNAFVERVIPVNELLSLLGLFVLISEYNSIKASKIVKLLVAIHIVGLLQVLLSFFFISKAPSLYVFFRTTPVWYSMFSFYVGIKIYGVVRVVQQGKVWNVIKKTLLISNFFSPERFTVFVSAPLLLQNTWLLVLYMLALRFVKGEDTELLFVFFTISFMVLNSYKLLFRLFFNKYSIVVALCAFFFLLKYTFDNFSIFFDLKQENAYTFLGVERDNGLANIVWRWMLWTYTFHESLLVNSNSLLFGIGFGIPIFDTYNAPEFLLVDIEGKDVENQAFFLGTHNSIYFLLLRQGFLVFSLFLAMLITYFSQLKNKISIISAQDKSIVLSFFLILIGACFNVILESPVYASIFWIHFGMAVAVVQNNEK